MINLFQNLIIQNGNFSQTAKALNGLCIFGKMLFLRHGPDSDAEREREIECV